MPRYKYLGTVFLVRVVCRSIPRVACRLNITVDEFERSGSRARPPRAERNNFHGNFETPWNDRRTTIVSLVASTRSEARDFPWSFAHRNQEKAYFSIRRNRGNSHAYTKLLGKRVSFSPPRSSRNVRFYIPSIICLFHLREMPTQFPSDASTQPNGWSWILKKHLIARIYQ